MTLGGLRRLVSGEAVLVLEGYRMAVRSLVVSVSPWPYQPSMHHQLHIQISHFCLRPTEQRQPAPSPQNGNILLPILPSSGGRPQISTTSLPPPITPPHPSPPAPSRDTGHPLPFPRAEAQRAHGTQQAVVISHGGPAIHPGTYSRQRR